MSDERPNILWYCTDQQRFDTIGALGNPHVQTPTIDRLVAEGTAFTHAYCQSPICTPSRSSFMTGLYPSRLHNTRNGNESFPDGPPLVSKLLSDSGYACGLVGKFHLQSSGHRTEPRLDDGYSYWKFSHAPRDDWPTGHDYAEWVRERGGDLDAMRHSPERVPPEFHQTTWASDRSIEFIRQAQQPWLLSVNIYDPHPPFIPPQVYADRFDPAAMPGPHFRTSDLEQQRKLRAVDFQDEIRTPEQHDAFRKQADYYAMIAQIDDQFTRILNALEEAGQRENTVVIFTSDHGEALGDHGLMYKGCRFYEGLVRVPLIFRWPCAVARSPDLATTATAGLPDADGDLRSNERRGRETRAEQGQQCPVLVELLDLTATLIDLAELPQPEYMQGKSLLPILRGEASPEHHREFVRCEYFDALDASFTGGTGTFATMYRDRRYKLSVYHGHGLGELYDLEQDPWEFENLWDHSDFQKLKHELLHASFDAHVLLTTDVGSRRIAPM